MQRKTVSEYDAYDCFGGDWKDPPETVLEAVDRALAPHGLEVVWVEDGSDSYGFVLQPRAVQPDTGER